MLKQGEVDAVKVMLTSALRSLKARLKPSLQATNSELSNQIASLKTRVNVADSSPGTSHKMQTLAARASAAEKRLTATQAHLQEVEGKFAEAKDKAATAEDQWAARLKEMLERQKKLEEKLKRERQGAKERVRDLEQNVM